MPASALVLLVVPGKLDAWRELMAQCTDDNPDYVDSRQRLGITREQVFLHGNEGEEFVIYYIEAENLDEAMIGMGVSLDPFDQWFRIQVKSIHDLILADPPPWPEQALDFQD
ncbi:MAG: hypothetical protein QOH36_642 [Actinomycetota bacterium]|nr:hypothetical protein [Actinomycetota bacterium]